MTTKRKALIDRLTALPEELLDDVEESLDEIEKQDHSGLRLPEEQAAEVRRRLANPSARPVPAEEVFRKLRSS
jgi:hypothetical protein